MPAWLRSAPQGVGGSALGRSPWIIPTIFAAQQSERICYAIDIDCRCIDVAVQRGEKFRGNVAKLASDGQTLEQAREERHR